MKHNLAAIATIIVAACAPSLSRASTNAFYFVQISDTHEGRAVHHFRYTNAIDRINNLPFPIDMIAHTGDFASDNLERNAVAISNLLHSFTIAPVIPVAGNHDLSLRGSDPAKRLADCIESYRTNIGELGIVRETENALYIAACTEGLFNDFTGVTDFDPVKFVRDALAANTTGKPAFVFTHRPDSDDFYNDQLHPSRMQRREEWRKMLADGKATAVISGHFHREELHNDAHGVPTYVAGPIAGYWGRQGSYRIYYYKDNHLSYHTVYIEDPRETAE